VLKHVQHPMNRKLFGSPRYSEVFKASDLTKQAGLEKTDGRPKENAIFDVDAVFTSMRQNI